MKKKMLALFICLAIVIATVITFAVAFNVKHIEVLVSIDSEEKFDKSKIVTDSQIKLGSSIFSLSEKVAVTNIERNNPYAKVVNIERVFPSSIHVNIVYRSPIMCVDIEGGKSILLDRELKILEFVDSAVASVANVSKVIGLNVSSITPEHVGLMLEQQGKAEILQHTVLAIESVGMVNEFAKVFVAEYDMSNSSYLVVRTRKGLNLALRVNANIDVKTQFLSLFSVFENSPDRENSAKYLYYTEQGIKTDTSLPI